MNNGSGNAANNNGVDSVLNKNDAHTTKANAFKPNLPRTPQDKAHNYKNWKDS